MTIVTPRTRLLTTALAALMLLLAQPPALAQKTVTMTASDWAPYVDTSTRDKGAIVYLVKTALERAGYEVKLVVEDWPASFDKVNDGTYDVLACAWYSDERNKTLAFSDPILENDLLLMKRSADRFVWYGRESLAGKRIGVVDDYAYTNKQPDTSDLDIVTGLSVTENIRRLLDGELDFVLGDYMVLRHEADELIASQKLDVVPKLIERRQLRLAVSRANPDHDAIVSAFDAAIEAMKEDGTYQSILATHRISF